MIGKIIIGVLIIAVGLALLFGLTFFLLPKKLIHYVYSYDVKEGELSSDFSYYVSERENKDVFDSYHIFYDKNASQKVLHIDFKEEIHRVKFYVIFFDYADKPIQCKEYLVEDAQFQNEITVPMQTRGAYVQVMENEDTVYVKQMPLVLDNTHLIIASLIYGLLSSVCTFICTIGYMTFAFSDPFAMFSTKFLALFVVLLSTFLLFSIGAFFLIRLAEKNRLKEKQEANL